MSRFCDYFVVCGVGKQLKSLLKNKNQNNSNNINLSSSSNNNHGNNHGNQSIESSSLEGNPFSTPFQSEILERFPPTNWNDGPLPNHIWMVILSFLLSQSLLLPPC
eukprot:TRINITY_DN5311_c0_g1_i3.p1 TRINITY_DN5311_c0_g1~~TRINITY_DN5311_c0_g1_i3.p1  ORF type:complete len:106 (-),score=40.24 TRINITY_DN5311_c0_g1_i3:4-321(-)